MTRPASKQSSAETRLEEAYESNRKLGHFQVRLDPELAKQLRAYMQSRDLTANRALNIIVSKFFKGHA